MKVHDAMTKQPSCCTPDTSLEAVARMMVDCDCGAIPVVADLASRMPMGIITDRDIVVRTVAVGIDPRGLHVRECMTTPAFTVTEDQSLDTAVELLEERQIRRAIVVDNAGRVIGILAQADVASRASKRTAGELLQHVSKPAAHVEFAPPAM